MIVMKFGGTSVESAAAIQRVASIVKARAARRLPEHTKCPISWFWVEKLAI